MGPQICVALFLTVFFIAVQGFSLPVGTAAWIYDLPGQPGMFAHNISQFNLNTDFPINTLFVYGGDLEYASGATDPFQVYYPTSNQLSAQSYKNVTGVTLIILVVDGVMNGGDTYDPDMSKFTTSQVQQWANNTAKTYCAHDEVGGIQIDLEPYKSPYITNTLVYLAQLSQNLLSTDFGCKNTAWPNGRSISFYIISFLTLSAFNVVRAVLTAI
eukprot:TRINITY_DN7562_c0_g1_i2.p1 TRINITY_DN7562_c0_g1~~TRINITY_DN7562_c0_g1_i2.p1  ORF type:complete len:214 (-),score=35.35 TRINITY_DN7562_c0_g1_i2:782-1423(-)